MITVETRQCPDSGDIHPHALFVQDGSVRVACCQHCFRVYILPGEERDHHHHHRDQPCVA